MNLARENAPDMPIIAIASGKGGTGKTTVAVNLALAWAEPVRLFDCDVEEPNAHLFLRQEGLHEEVVTVPVPQVDMARCDACGECARFCAYHAIVAPRTKPLVFRELCHSCGGCRLVCPQGAILEVDRRIGTLATSTHDSVTLIQGRLDVGVAMSPSLIRAVKKRIDGEGISILDAPPGTSCPVVTTVRGADMVALVTEPTPFGLHDLRLAVDMVRALERPFGVIVNRRGIGDDRVHSFCATHGIRVLGEIPDDRRIAEASSRGVPLVEALPEYRDVFRHLVDSLVAACESRRVQPRARRASRRVNPATSSLEGPHADLRV